MASSPMLGVPVVWVAVDTGHLPLTSTRPPLSSLRCRASFSAFASAISFVYLASSAAGVSLAGLHVRDGVVRQAELLGHFVPLPFELGRVVVVVTDQPSETDYQADHNGADNGC